MIRNIALYLTAAIGCLAVGAIAIIVGSRFTW